MSKIISEERVTKYALDAKTINFMGAIHKTERTDFLKELGEGATFSQEGPYAIRVDVRAGNIDWAAEYEKAIYLGWKKKKGAAYAQRRLAKLKARIAKRADRGTLVELTPDINPRYRDKVLPKLETLLAESLSMETP